MHMLFYSPGILIWTHHEGTMNIRVVEDRIGTCNFFCLLMDSSFGRRKKIFYCQQEEILGMRIVGMLCLPTRQVHYIIPQSPSRGICPSLPPVINPGSTTRLARSPHNCAC